MSTSGARASPRTRIILLRVLTDPVDSKEKELEAETLALQGLFSGQYGLDHAVSLASEDFKFEMQVRSGDRPEYAFVEAANARVAPLGINITAWAAACDRMGRVRAALCVLLLDAKPGSPDGTRP